MGREKLTVTIITCDEEKNLPQALLSVQWADEVIVVDSGSQDQTLDIAKRSGARVISQEWLGYGKQKNFAQKQAQYDWVFNIDADEVVSQELRQEILNALNQIHSQNAVANEIRGFSIPRKTFYSGRWIRHGGWYPDYKTRLVNRHYASWTEPAVHEVLVVTGKVIPLQAPIEHYSFSGLEDQVLTNLNFSKLGSIELKKKNHGFCLSYLVFKPFGKFLETYFLKLGFLDGLPGFMISINAAYSIFLKYGFLNQSLKPLNKPEINHARSHH